MLPLIQKLRFWTYLHYISSVKIGVLGQHSSAQLLQNLSTALPHVIKNISENWDNVQSIHIKTSLSASLPIWSCRLDEEEGGRWDGLTRVPIPDDKEPIKAKQKAVRAAAVDFFDTSGPEDPPSPSKTSPCNTTTSRKSTEPKSSSDPEHTAPKKSKAQSEKSSGIETMFKSSKKTPESSSVDLLARKKRMKFVAKLSDRKGKRDKALGLMDKKVRSGGGKGASVKDRALGKKVAVR